MAPAPGEALAAMIAPAVLISAAGLLSLSTSNRLARVVDRSRSLAREYRISREGPRSPEAQDREQHLTSQLAALTQRARLVQGALTMLYVALSLFILTSLLLGIGAAVGWRSWIPLGSSMAGGACLLVASLLLINEARLAVRSLGEEIGFLRRIGRAG